MRTRNGRKTRAFLAWIDRLDADLKKRDRVPKGWEHVNVQLDHARATYRRVAGEPAK